MRRPLAWLVVWTAVSLAPLGGAIGSRTATGQTERLEASAEAMGTTFSLVLLGPDHARLEAAAAAAFAEAHRFDRLLSNYRADSEWSAVNRSAARQPVTVSAELFDLLSACLAYSEQSGGAFDITVGPLMRAWGFYSGDATVARPGDGALPRAAEISHALGRVGYRHVTLDPATRSVRFDRDGIELDPGGVGKGYAVDRMVDVLKRRGVAVALVSAGSSTIYGLGASPDEPAGWTVAIQLPGSPNRVAVTITLKDAALSTSGSYEKFFWADGRIYSHLMDPRTGSPAWGTASVSVVAPTAIESEVWTKPYFVNGRAWTTQHRRPTHRVFFCEDVRPPRCGWVE